MTDSQREHITDGVPALAPHRFGLRSVANFTQRNNGRWLNGIDWDQNCGTGVNEAYVYCDPNIPEDFVKEAYEKGYGNADAFALYAMIECSLLLGEDDKTKAQAELVLGEDYAVERRLATQVLAEATDLVPAGLPVKAAVGAAIQAFTLTSRAEPIVHVSPNVAAFLDLRDHGKYLSLPSGEKVSVGYGYAEGFGGTAYDDYALFVTGPLLVLYGTAQVVEAPVIVDNEHVVLAERPWLIGTMCDSVRVSVKDLLV